MKSLQKTLFIIGLVILSTQTLRHVYVKFLEPRESILDKYNEKIEERIEESKSIDELAALYDDAHRKVEEYENNSANPRIRKQDRDSEEPYKDEKLLREAIENWELHNNLINKLRFFWACGFASILAGFIIYVKADKWIGIVGLITGFSEMTFWTSPTIFGFFGARVEFERLLNNKLVFALISWLLLIIVWLLQYRIPGKDRKYVDQ